MRSPSEKYNIICLSNQLWDYPLWTNKKHVMSRLSQGGHHVLFVDPPINLGRVFFKHLLMGEWGISRIFTQKKNEDSLVVFSPLDIFLFSKQTSLLHINKINQTTKHFFDKERKTLLWVYNVELPGLENYLKGIKHDFLIYDCVDNYPAFPRYNTPEKKRVVVLQEQLLASRANVCFATAPGLAEKLKKLNKNTYYTPNVGDYERFKNVRSLKNQIPNDLKNIPQPIVGFTGAVDEYKFDRELFRKIATDYPGYSFVIIGPMALQDREADLKQLGLSDLKNVYFLGSRPYAQIPSYLAGFAMAIIPYQINDYTVGGCFPVKFHEELAAGLPVIVTDLPAYQPFASFCYISKDYNEFSQNIRRAVEENSEEKILERQKIAKENTWEGKVKKLLDIIGDHLNEKIKS